MLSLSHEVDVLVVFSPFHETYLNFIKIYMYLDINLNEQSFNIFHEIDEVRLFYFQISQ
jgi:hypothetical protein